MVNDLNLSNEIKFFGIIDEKEKINMLHECGIYVQPSRYEGFGLAIAEAGLCGAPLITSPVGAVPEVTNNHCTYVNCDPQEIADAVELIFNNYEDSIKKAGLAQSFIQENFNYARRKDDIKRILINQRIL